MLPTSDALIPIFLSVSAHIALYRMALLPSWSSDTSTDTIIIRRNTSYN